MDSFPAGLREDPGTWCEPDESFLRVLYRTRTGVWSPFDLEEERARDSKRVVPHQGRAGPEPV